GFLTLLEIDPQLVKWLSIFFAEAENVEILLQDALTFDFPGHCRQKQKEAYKVVANLPYYITSDLIEQLLVKGGNWQSMTLMMQKEAAARLLAPAGSKDYGPLNLRIAYFAEAEEFLQVPPESFYPQPPVQSSVIFLRRRQKPPVDIKNEKLFFMIIEAALTQRRKTILNNLANSSLGLNKPLWQEVLLSCNIDSKRRGETLTLTEFASIANAIDEELDCQ
ncbi:MAG: rRNA adenine dimethyltransferase family protein, partial [Clostridiales bacterium]